MEKGLLKDSLILNRLDFYIITQTKIFCNDWLHLKLILGYGQVCVNHYNHLDIKFPLHMRKILLSLVILQNQSKNIKYLFRF